MPSFTFLKFYDIIKEKERKRKLMGWIFDYDAAKSNFEDDICWCADSVHCSNIKCFRNDKTRRQKAGVFTYAALKNTDMCPSYFGKENE